LRGCMGKGRERLNKLEPQQAEAAACGGEVHLSPGREML
jgi:hypothetical protein